MDSFSKLSSTSELIEFLSQKTRMNGTDRVFHYTTYNAYKGIKTGEWYFSNPKNMNDKFEYSKFKNRFDNIYFGSFQSGKSENLGMWSMYAQPWSSGVIISIKSEYFKRWIDNIKYCYEANTKTKKAKNKRRIPVSAKFSKVIYTKDNTNWLKYSGSVNNTVISTNKTAYDYPELAGYIKDIAWEYENEFRIVINIQSGQHYDGIVVEMPEIKDDDIVLIQGPKFLNPSNSQKKSMFYKKLGWVGCDTCKYKIDDASFRKLESFCNKKNKKINDSIKEAIDKYTI